MHSLIKHIAEYISISLFLISSMLICSNANSEQSVEDIIKGRKALFSKNYKTAKRVQSLSSSGDFDEAKKLMIVMSKNYEVLLGLFPENSREGFKTGSLSTIWENKEAFDLLMKKSSKDMVKLTSVIENKEDINGTITKLMCSNCKACHSKYRKEH